MTQAQHTRNTPPKDAGIGPPPLPTSEVLSKSETRIAVGYTDCLIGKEIADRYNISYNTVVKHTQNIYEKAGIRHSTNALVAWFLGKNYGLDLGELRRAAESLFLLVLFFIGLANSADNTFSRRAPTRRVESRKGGRRKTEDDSMTYFL